MTTQFLFFKAWCIHISVLPDILHHQHEPHWDEIELQQMLMPVNGQGLAVNPEGCNNSSAVEWRVLEKLSLIGKSERSAVYS